MKDILKKTIIAVVFAAYCGFILYLTVLSRHPGQGKMDLRFMWSYREYLAGNKDRKKDVIQNLQNILLFVPFGFFHPVKKWAVVIGSGLLFSLAIELLQYFGGYGLAELDDLICNTLGAAIGFLICMVFQKAVGKEHA